MTDAGHDATPHKRSKSRAKLVSRLITVGLLVAAVGSYLLGEYTTLDETSAALAHSVAEALFVAFVLVIAGDFYLRFRLADESIRRGVKDSISETFGFLDPAQPPELKAAVRAFAGSPVYLRTLTWTIRFDWEDRDRGILRMTLGAECNGRSLQHEGYLPTGETWVLESTLDHQSRYLSYGLHCPQSDIQVYATTEELDRYCRRNAGRLLLDRGRLLGDRLRAERIKYSHDFSRTTSAEMYRRTPGHVPLAHTHFAILFELRITGDAVPDLTFVAFHPKTGDQEWRVNGSDASDPVHHEWRNVTPGEVTIVSWTRPTPVSN